MAKHKMEDFIIIQAHKVKYLMDTLIALNAHLSNFNQIYFVIITLIIIYK